MAIEKLQVILDAVWRGKSEVQKANKDIKNVDESVGKTQASFKKFAVGAGVAAGALVAVGAAAKVAWDTLGEGAALLRSQDQFEKLAASIGSTADVMLGKLKEATGGLVSDAQLVASAGEIISLGLASTEGDVVRLANLVTQLGWDMQQVILTFANNSKARLDSLGLSVEDVNTKMRDLEAQGYSTDAAFDLAVIEAGEEKLKLLGSAAGTAAGDLQNLIVIGENAANAFDESFATSLVDSLESVTGEAKNSEDAIVALAESGGAALASLIQPILYIAIGFTEVQAEILEARLELAKFKAGLPTGGLLGDIFGDIQAGGASDLSAIGQQLLDVRKRSSALKGGIQETTEAYQGLVTESVALTTSTDVNTNDMLKMSEAVVDTGAAMADQRQEGYALIQGYEQAGAAVQDLTDNIGGSGGLGPAVESAAEKMARLAAETGNFFDQARRSDDFDPAEAFYQSALSAGASAEQLRQLLVTTGLESPERAQEIYNESIQRQLASLAGQAVAGGDNIDMLWQGVQAGIANPQLAAQQVSNVTNVGGVSVSVVINGDISGEDLDMTVDNAVGTATEALGGQAPA